MPRQLELLEKPPRKQPRKLMHVIDAGDSGCVMEPKTAFIAKFKCACGYESGWLQVNTTTEARRGLPCPACNPDT
jgi:hypothetical protein